MNCLPKQFLLLVISTIVFCQSMAQSIVHSQPGTGRYALTGAGLAISVFVDQNDFTIVKKAATHLQQDLASITGKMPMLSFKKPTGKQVIIIGSTERSSLIADLVHSRKLRLDSIAGKWEAFQIQTVAHPFPGVATALVITGNDRRGPAYGAFELSKQSGLSPWYWWADVPPQKKQNLYIDKAAVLIDFPRVRYRGIFINDEAPALSNWTKKIFGGFNHLLYDKVFELILRLKGNYLWPAMWGNAFYADDPENIKSADDYAVVIGTSHHEPLMRAHDEWRRFGKGAWNYDSNEQRLKDFWHEGMKRATNEKIVSIGMRGDGDEPMSRETATALLERIVKDQREIIRETTGKPAEETPQLWALYKEVQEYYDKGMRVPDDVTLLLCDDNWGNIRKLPRLEDSARKGGYGIYYHFDYVGDPRNYKWLNTNNIARTWEQMHLAWAYHARQIWIVNVGDIKPMEYPISFFLDYAWNPELLDADLLPAYAQNWAAAQFGAKNASGIGGILTAYSQLSTHPKPELLDATTYSLTNFYEATRVLKQWEKLLQQARTAAGRITANCGDAYFQLVLHPIEARTNLQQLYHAVALNQHYFEAHDPRANAAADSAKIYYRRDSLLTIRYHQLNGGKWDHLMDQTHIGYTYWQQPELNSMPTVLYLKTATGAKALTNQPTITAEPVLSVLADHYSRAIQGRQTYWKTIPHIGREGAAVTSFPVTHSPATDSLFLEYDFITTDNGPVSVYGYFSPTLDFQGQGGLRHGIRIDDGPEQILTVNPHPVEKAVWEKWVADNIIIDSSKHHLNKIGKHILRYRVLDPGILLQKLVVQKGPLPASLLGPPETAQQQKSKQQ